MFPGEPDAAEQLQAVLGGTDEAVGAQRPGRGPRPARPRPESSASTASAASQATDVICSTRTAMSASRCLTAWNCPIGRPNCTRTFAYSVAVSRHHRAPPTCSAASSATTSRRTRPPSTPRSRRRHGTTTARRRLTAANRRVGSRLARGSTPDRVPADLEHAPSLGVAPIPDGATTMVAVWAPRTGRSVPDTSTSPSGPGPGVEHPGVVGDRPHRRAVGQTGHEPASASGPLQSRRPSARPRPPSAGADRGPPTTRSPRAGRRVRTVRSPVHRGPRGGGCRATPGSAIPFHTGSRVSASASSTDRGTSGGQWASSHRRPRAAGPRARRSARSASALLAPPSPGVPGGRRHDVAEMARVGHPRPATRIRSSPSPAGSSDHRDPVVGEVERRRGPERRSCPSRRTGPRSIRTRPPSHASPRSPSRSADPAGPAALDHGGADWSGGSPPSPPRPRA